MNSFYEHHKDSIHWHYRCFDRILLTDLLQCEFSLIFYSANSQAIECMWKSAPKKRLGTTFRMIS